MIRPLIPLALIVCLASGATAQTGSASTPGPTSPLDRLTGGLGGLLGGGALPSVGSIGAGNAAGLLGYCLKNKLLGQGGALGALAGGRNTTARPPASPAGAQSILQQLTGRQNVKASPEYAAGQAGEVQAPNGPGFSFDDLGGKIKTQMCSVVLKRAKSFL
jgi:hypothetical protein